MKTLMKTLGLILVACVVGLLIVEGGLRLIGYSRPPLYQYSAAMGADHRPNTEGWYEKENLIYVRINSDGVRGPEVPRDKPDGIYRIAVLGDSFAEGFQVGFEERFSQVAQEALSRCDGLTQKVEVINFGVSGYGTAREIQMLRERAVHYDPDLVFLLFVPVNDIRNNIRELEGNPLIPYFDLEDGVLVFDESYRSDPVFQRKLTWSNLRNDIVYRLRILQVLQDFYVRYIVTGRLLADDPQAGAADGGGGRSHSLTYDAPEGPLELEAWDVTEAMLKLIRDETAAADMQFWMATVPTMLALIGDPQQRAAVLEARGLETATYVEDRLRAFAADEGIDYLNLSEAMQHYAEAGGPEVDYFYFEHLVEQGGHWNSLGHRVVGEAMAAALCAALQNGSTNAEGPAS